MTITRTHGIMGMIVLGAVLTVFTFGTTLTYTPAEAEVTPEETLSKTPVHVSAKSILVTNASTGEILLEKESDTGRPIASITKLFSAYAAHTAADIDEEVLIEWQDFSTEGTSGTLKLGETYSVRDLLFPLLLASSNDAGTAIERALGASYAKTLNALYTDAGLSRTTIVDGSGLSSGNVSTAEDLARFYAFLAEEDQYILDITSLHSYAGPYRGWMNNNPGRTFSEFEGGKHGYTDEAGRTFVGSFATESGEYTVVLLGSSDLKADLAQILSLL